MLEMLQQLSTLRQFVYGSAAFLAVGVLLRNMWLTYTGETPGLGAWLLPTAFFVTAGFGDAWIALGTVRESMASASTGNRAAIGALGLGRLTQPLWLAILGGAGALIPSIFFITGGDDESDGSARAQLAYFAGVLVFSSAVAAVVYFGVPALAGFEDGARPATSLVDDALAMGVWTVWVGIGLTRAAGCESAFRRIVEVSVLGMVGVVCFYAMLRLMTLGMTAELLGGLGPAQRMRAIGLSGETAGLRAVDLPLMLTMLGSLALLGALTAAIFRPGFEMPSAGSMVGGLVVLGLIGGLGSMTDRRLSGLLLEVKELASGPMEVQNDGTESEASDESDAEASGADQAEASDRDRPVEASKSGGYVLPKTLSELRHESLPAIVISVDDIAVGATAEEAETAVELSDGGLSESAVSDGILPQLKKAMDETIAEQEKQAKMMGQKFRPVFNLVVERTTPYPLVLRVVATAHASDIRKFKVVAADADTRVDVESNSRRSVEPFAPLDPESRQIRVINVATPAGERREDGEAGHTLGNLSDPKPPPSGDGQRRPSRMVRQLDLTISVRPRGFDVGATGGILPPIEGCPEDGPTICLRKQEATPAEGFAAARKGALAGDFRQSERNLEQAIGAYDFPALYRKVLGIKEQYAGESSFTVTAVEEAPFAMAVRVMDAVRWRRDVGSDPTNEDFWKAERAQRRERKRPTPVGLFGHPMLPVVH